MPCIYIDVLLQNPFNAGKSSYGSPFDSTYGMPGIIQIRNLCLLALFVFVVYRSIKKGKK